MNQLKNLDLGNECFIDIIKIAEHINGQFDLEKVGYKIEKNKNYI